MPIYRVPNTNVEDCVRHVERLGERVISITPSGDDMLVLTEERTDLETRPAS